MTYALMNTDHVRTTVDLQDDVAKAVEARRRATGHGLSATINELVREGLLAQQSDRPRFVQTPAPLGLRIDVSNVAEALDLLDDQD